MSSEAVETGGDLILVRTGIRDSVSGISAEPRSDAESVHSANTRVPERSRTEPSPRGGEVRKVRKAGRHRVLSEAAEALRRSPNSDRRFNHLASTLLGLLEADAVPRARGRRVYMAKRAAALLNTYCGELKEDVRQRLFAALQPLFRELELRANAAPQSTHVTETQAAVQLGLTRLELMAMIRHDPEVRRRLGWPMPFGEHRVLIAAAALDPRTAAAYVASMPASEPWTNLPVGWRK